MAPSRAARAAAVARILTGVIFIGAGIGKVAGDFVRGGFAASAREVAEGPSWPFWSVFLRSIVIPNATGFGWFVALAEIALGVSLLLGFLVRPATLGGIVLMLLVLFGQSHVPGKEWTTWVTAGLTTKFALLLLWLLFIVDAGRGWGLDARLRKGPRLRLR